MLYALYSLENRNIIEYGGVSMKIFIIEDEPAIREELVQLLQSTATNATAAMIFTTLCKLLFHQGLT